MKTEPSYSFQLISEPHSAAGGCCPSVSTELAQYCFNFNWKLNSTANVALRDEIQGVLYCQNVTLFHITRVPVTVFMSIKKSTALFAAKFKKQILQSSVCDHQHPSRNTKILHVQRPSFLSDLNKTLIFCIYFLIILKYQISWKSIQR